MASKAERANNFRMVRQLIVGGNGTLDMVMQVTGYSKSQARRVMAKVNDELHGNMLLHFEGVLERSIAAQEMAKSALLPKVLNGDVAATKVYSDIIATQLKQVGALNPDKVLDYIETRLAERKEKGH